MLLAPRHARSHLSTIAEDHQRQRVFLAHAQFARCRVPSSRRDYWTAKMRRNAARDKRTQRELRQSGWRVLVIWECQTSRVARGSPTGPDHRFPGQGCQATVKEGKHDGRKIASSAAMPRTELGRLPPDSVDLTVTSPPYFRHRDYGVSGQLGREATVDDYVKNLAVSWRLCFESRPATGSCFFVVGDTYEKQKLLLVPHRLALAANEIGWSVRNDLIWSKLDPPPESPRNRWRCGHEHVLFLTKRPGKYTFHADAIRVPYADATKRQWGNGQVYGGPKSEERPNGKASRMRHGKTSS